jgi:hypothetical protein
MEPKVTNIDGFHGIKTKEKTNIHKLKYIQTNSMGAE